MGSVIGILLLAALVWAVRKAPRAREPEELSHGSLEEIARAKGELAARAHPPNGGGVGGGG
jgi:hypothetical protein